MNLIELLGRQSFKKYNSLLITKPKDYNITTNDQLICRLEKESDPNRYLYYDFYGYSDKYTMCDITPEELYDVYHNNFSIKSSTVVPVSKNKIFFCDSTFPSLLLGRLGTDLSRTTKVDTADIIVSDCNITYRDIFHNICLLDLNNKINFGNLSLDRNETKVQFVDKINKIIQIAKSNFNYDLKFYCSVTAGNLDIYEAYKKYSSKFISTKDFIKYVISQLPILGEDECNNICYMLKSSDKSTVSTALGTLQYYNFFESGIDLLNALSSSSCYDLPNNREAEYIYYLFGLNRSNIIDSKGYRIRRKIQFLMDALNKFIITPSMSVKEKVVAVLRQSLFDQICNDYKEEFDRLDVTLNLIPNDKNGETAVSSSEMEGE